MCEDKDSVFLQSWLSSASASACEQVWDIPGLVHVEDKTESVRSKSWPGTAHKHSLL